MALLLYVYAEHMIVRFANEFFTVLIKDKHASQQCANFPMGLTTQIPVT